MSKQTKTMEQLKDSRLLYDKKLPAFGYMLIITVTALLVGVLIWSIKTPKNEIVTSPGTVQSSNKNYVMAPFTGEISEVSMEEGKNVEKGDLLFTVKSTDLDLQGEQLEGQKQIYEEKIAQYQKLVKSIQDDTNYFNPSSEEENLYYSQYENYKSQVNQQTVDTSAYQAYGYTQEQIEAELVKNQSKISELYYQAIQSAEASIAENQTQLDALEAQLEAIGNGQEEYRVTATADGKIHMLSEYKEGMVVQATTALASIASEQDVYLVQAYVQASDATRVHVGDTVDIAVSGLTQSVYGTISGKVVSMDSDVNVAQDEEGKGTSSYFKVQIEPETTYLVSKNGEKVNISNGMEVETRIHFDKVSYFNYVLEALGVLTR